VSNEGVMATAVLMLAGSKETLLEGNHEESCGEAPLCIALMRFEWASGIPTRPLEMIFGRQEADRSMPKTCAIGAFTSVPSGERPILDNGEERENELAL